MTHWPELPEQPKISVVTVSFNQGEFVRQNIESVLAQGYPNLEHIIVDGGSKDGTLDILRQYPHLKWTSEPDRNQSDALNKGFARADGDIICWLNSDDWLAEDAFSNIIPILRTHPVVLTAAAQTDRAGNIQEVVANTARSWYDLLRYWVPYAWLAQTGVFFRRSLLEQIKREEGYTDESLHFVMDMDVWMRMARVAPFAQRLDKVCAFFRMYEENKTGRSPLSTQKECGRVFRRYSHESCRAERKISFVFPLDQLSQGIARTLDSLMRQTVREFDILFVDHSTQAQETVGILKLMEEIEKAINVVGIRYLRAKDVTQGEALNKGLLAAAAPLVATAFPGDEFEPSFVAEALNIFALDPTALAIPVKDKPDLHHALYQKETMRLRDEALLTDVDIPLNFVARKALIEELGGVPDATVHGLAIRELAIAAIAKGWHVNADNSLGICPAASLSQPRKSYVSEHLPFIQAKVIDLAASISEKDAFAPVRMQHGWGASFSSQAIQAARAALRSAGSGV